MPPGCAGSRPTLAVSSPPGSMVPPLPRNACSSACVGRWLLPIDVLIALQPRAAALYRSAGRGCDSKHSPAASWVPGGHRSLSCAAPATVQPIRDRSLRHATERGFRDIGAANGFPSDVSSADSAISDVLAADAVVDDVVAVDAQGGICAATERNRKGECRRDVCIAQPREDASHMSDEPERIVGGGTPREGQGPGAYIRGLLRARRQCGRRRYRTASLPHEEDAPGSGSEPARRCRRSDT
jgi:hypothetical protein